MVDPDGTSSRSPEGAASEVERVEGVAVESAPAATSTPPALSEGEEASGSRGSPSDESGTGSDSRMVNATDSPSESAEPAATSLTPSGIEIAFFQEPRHYKLRYPIGHDSSDEEWCEVPSVSTITDLLKDTGPLVWHGQTVGIQGCLALIATGHLRPYELHDGQISLVTLRSEPQGFSELVVAGVDEVTELLKAEKMTVNHVKSAAGRRGNSAHGALEAWTINRKLPDPSEYPPAEQGYVEGLRMFLADLEKGGVEDIESEVMVGSIEHGFAGRYDIRFLTTEKCSVVKRWTPKRGPQYVTLEPGLYMGDLKTSKGVFPNHVVQLEGYEGASVECGYGETVARGVIHVHPGDPKDDKQPDTPYYEFVRSWGRFEGFLALLDVYNEVQYMKEAKKA